MGITFDVPRSALAKLICVASPYWYSTNGNISDNEVIITAVSSVKALISVSPKIMKTREDIVAIAIRMWNPAKEIRRILALSFSPAALDTSTETLAAKL
jgi:hypothetical protein